MLQHLESRHQPGWWAGKGWWSWLLRAIIKGCHLPPAPSGVTALRARPQHGRSWLSWTLQLPPLHGFFLRFYLLLLMFSLLNSWSNNDRRSAVLLLCTFDFPYHYRDGIMALSQQSESRFHCWNASKLDSCKMTAKSFGGEINSRDHREKCYSVWL